MSLIYALLLLFAAAAHGQGPRFIFTFGDSYSSTTFNVDGTKPTEDNPLGNPAYGLYTSCAYGNSTYCPNWIDVLTVNLSLSNTLSYDFAVGGAVIDNIDSDSPTAPHNFSLQLDMFTNSVASKPSYAPWDATNSVFIAWFGVNDLLGIGQKSNTSEADISTDLDDLFTHFVTLYNYGARRFVVFNAPPFDKAPIFGIGNPNGPNVAGNITIWNNDLPGKARSFTNSYTDATVNILDTQPLFHAVLDNPDQYPQPWANFLHPAVDIHSMVATGAHDLLQSIGFYS